MTALPIIGALLELAGYVTQWPVFRWVGYAVAIAGQLLALYFWRKAQMGPSPCSIAVPVIAGSLETKRPLKPTSVRDDVR